MFHAWRFASASRRTRPAHVDLILPFVDSADPMSSSRRFAFLYRFRGEEAHAGRALRLLRQQEERLDSRANMLHRLPRPADRLGTTEHGLDALTFALRDRITFNP